jgi:DNA-binding NarL/FixJ family response regulator
MRWNRTQQYESILPNGLGGKEAIIELLKIDPKAKVIVSSGYSNDQVMSDYIDYGFRHAMPKPYWMKDFESVIRIVMTCLPRTDLEMENRKDGNSH